MRRQTTAITIETNHAREAYRIALDEDGAKSPTTIRFHSVCGRPPGARRGVAGVMTRSYWEHLARAAQRPAAVDAFAPEPLRTGADDVRHSSVLALAYRGYVTLISVEVGEEARTAWAASITAAGRRALARHQTRGRGGRRPWRVLRGAAWSAPSRGGRPAA
ncbi:hypothetical protein [Streptomyces noursei]